MILIIYNLTIVINFNSCMFIIMIIIILTYRGFLSTNTHTYALFCYSFILHLSTPRGHADIINTVQK